MKANFDCNKLVSVHYPEGGAGKFITYCLGLHEDVLFQHIDLIHMKMKESKSVEWSFNRVLLLFRKMLTDNFHYEFGCDYTEMMKNGKKEFRSNAEDYIDESDIWFTLTNQDRFYFFMVAPDYTLEEDYFYKYKNKKNIILKNFDWIRKDRNRPAFDENTNIHCLENALTFDMNSIKSKNSFKEEIHKTFDYLGLQFTRYDLVEKLRVLFLKTYKIGFINDRP